MNLNHMLEVFQMETRSYDLNFDLEAGSSFFSE